MFEDGVQPQNQTNFRIGGRNNFSTKDSWTTTRNHYANIYLQSGEIHLSTTPSLVTTILGSCLAVTLWHPKKRMAAICHGFLPQCQNRSTCRNSCRERFKYVDCTLGWMIEHFLSQGIRLREIEIKVFGGADMFAVQNPKEENFRIGKQNIKTAMGILKEKGLPIVSHCVGGLRGRKIVFNTANGEVLLKYLVGVN